MDKRYVLAIDLGTTSIRTLSYDLTKYTFSNIAQRRLPSIYPQDMWVEQDPEEIMSIIYADLSETIANIPQDEIVGLGLTNQRETVVAWEKDTGRPLYNAIVWQCRRTQKLCEKLRADTRIKNFIQKKTGLLVDSYFSATKIKWLLDNVLDVKKALKQGNLCVGTLDSFVVYRLTKGKKFVTDHTNASRTMLYNLRDNDWDDELLQFFGVPREILPNIINCDEPIAEIVVDDKTINLGGMLGDQQASLLGQACTKTKDTKITYGTGAFMLTNIGDDIKISDKIITTLAWKFKNVTDYAFEGSMYNAGSCINWLKDELHLIEHASESETLAKSVPDSGGVLFVPALSGLGAPFWKSGTKADFYGITLATKDAHLVRAVLRGVSYNTRAVFDEMAKLIDIRNAEIRVDGGMTDNNAFVQFLSTILNNEITVSQEVESTSLGAVYACAMAFGVLRFRDINSLYQKSTKFYPVVTELDKQEKHYKKWLKIVENL